MEGGKIEVLWKSKRWEMVCMINICGTSSFFPRYVPKSSYAMIPLMTLASWKPYDGLYFDDAAKWSDWEQKVSPTGCCSKRKAE